MFFKPRFLIVIYMLLLCIPSLVFSNPAYFASKEVIKKIPDKVKEDIDNIFKKYNFNAQFSNLEKKSAKNYQYSNKTNKCAAFLVRELGLYIYNLDNETTKKTLRQIFPFTRPTNSGDEDFYGNGVNVKEYATQHFLIHYVNTTNNLHSVPANDSNYNKIPDIIENYAEIFEECWKKEIELEYSEPILNNDGYYDVYFLDMQSFFGDQAPLAYTATDPFLNHPIHSPTYIALDNDYADGKYGYITSDNVTDIVKVTFAHEFFHAIQLSYNSYIDSWFAEACATWMEDVIYDEVNDYYYYLPDFYNNPQFSLEHLGDTESDFVYEYGACVFPRYLSIKYDKDIIREIWEYTYNDTTKIYDNGLGILGIKNVLDKRGLSFASVLGDFRVASYFIGENYSDNYASKYYNDDEVKGFNIVPKIADTITKIDFKEFTSDSKISPQEYGVYYIELKSNSNKKADIKINFNGSSIAKWAGKIIKFKQDKTIEISDFDFINDYNANIAIQDFNSIYYKAILVIYVTSGNSKNEAYGFSLTNNTNNITDTTTTTATNDTNNNIKCFISLINSENFIPNSTITGFRDKYLTSNIGKYFINLYYRYSAFNENRYINCKMGTVK